MVRFNQGCGYTFSTAGHRKKGLSRESLCPQREDGTLEASSRRENQSLAEGRET
jgi:hypothetical protein